MELLTDRLLLRDATEDDVPALLTVALSNPEFLEIHEGPDAPTAYDESAVGRDLAVASMDPARHPLAVCSREDGAVFGWAEVLDEHPCDGVPWIGLLELRADAHGSGLGREAAEALAGWASAGRRRCGQASTTATSRRCASGQPAASWRCSAVSGAVPPGRSA